MFWQLISPEVQSLFVPIVNGQAITNVSFLFWVFVFIGIIMSIALHEFAHAWAAHKLGDDTALYLNRMNINPFNHFDILGFCLIIFTSIGYGKPVPVNTQNFRNPRRDLMLVALAGPMSNVFIALILAIFYIVLYPFVGQIAGNTQSLNGILVGIASTLFHSLSYIGMTNLYLTIFNMLPFIPLDGSKIWGYIHYKVEDFLQQYIFPYSVFFIILFIIPIFGSLSLLNIISMPFLMVYILIMNIPISIMS
jgi:Zn-dependent protease